MKMVATVLAACTLIAPAFAGDALTRRVVTDTWSSESKTGLRMESYSHGSNELILVLLDGKNTIVKSTGVFGTATALGQGGRMSVTVSGPEYSLLFGDPGSNGLFRTIMLSHTGIGLLEVLNLDSNGCYAAASQSAIDAINLEAKKIEKRLPNRKDTRNESVPKPPEGTP